MATDFDFEVKHWVDENPEVQLKMARDTIKSDRWLRDQYVAAFDQLEHIGFKGRLTVLGELHLIEILIDARSERPEDPISYINDNLPSVSPSMAMLAKGLAESAWGFCRKVGNRVFCSRERGSGRSHRRGSRSPSRRRLPIGYDADLAGAHYRKSRRSPSPRRRTSSRRSRSRNLYGAKKFRKSKRKNSHTRTRTRSRVRRSSRQSSRRSSCR